MSTAAAELSQRVQSGVQQIVGALRDAGAQGLGVREWTDLLGAAFTARNQFDSALTGAVGALDRAARASHDEVDTLGLSAPAWLEQTLNVSRNAAWAQVHLARRLPSMPDTAAAFERGELSAQHVSVVSRTVESVQRGGGDVAAAERLMLEEAAQYDPWNLHRRGLSLLHRLAPREMEAQEEQRRRSSHLHMRELFSGGYLLEGYLDPIGGATLKTAIEGVLGPRQKGDDRTPGQRRADAVVELAKRVLESGELPGRGGQKPQVVVTATLEALNGSPGAPAGLLDWGFPISGKAVWEIAGDAELIPILLNGNGDPLHVGRKYRTATPKMQKALAIRDRRCVWPGCDRPPHWSQGHHNRPWQRGGETNVDEMSILCVPHHRRLSRGWRLERQTDGRVIVHPPRVYRN